VPRLCLVPLVVVVVLAAVTAPGALAKGRVTAQIEQPARCDAKAGTTITIAFSLSSRRVDGTTAPFGAGGVFVKLRRASDRPPLKVAARRSGARGHYAARVRVPRGGIERIDAGLEGTTISGGVERDADVLFPTHGDPCRAAAA
jgi:hypothetical protein